MELLRKLRALFKPKPAAVPPAPLYSDEEFLEFIAAQARTRTRTREAPTAKTNPAAPIAPFESAA